MGQARIRGPSLACATLIALFGLVRPSHAGTLDDPVPPAGLISPYSNPCLLAKFGQGHPCAEPALPTEQYDAHARVAAHLARARFFISVSELRNALAEGDAALAIEPANVAIRHLVARLAMSTGDMPRAGREIAIALEQSPNDADLHTTNAVRLELLSAQDEALQELNYVLTQHPQHAFAREARAKLLLKLNRPKEAAADLDILLAEEHPNPVLWSLRGTADMAMNDPRRAVADFSKVLEDRPGQLIPLTARAAAYALAGDDTGALHDLDAILGPIGSRPNYAIGGDQLAKYRTQRAFVLVRLGRLSEAATEMNAALMTGGRSAILRTQVFLRQNGYPEIALDGRDSEALRSAVQACFGLAACFAALSQTI